MSLSSSTPYPRGFINKTIITAEEFATLQYSYSYEEKMRKVPNSVEANARYEVVLKECEKKFNEMIECNKTLGEIQKYEKIVEGLTLNKKELANLEQERQKLIEAIGSKEYLKASTSNILREGTILEKCKQKIDSLIHKKQKYVLEQQNRQKFIELMYDKEKLICLEQHKDTLIELIEQKQQIVKPVGYEKNLLELQKKKLLEIIKSYEKLGYSVSDELGGCLTSTQLDMFFKYFHPKLFLESWAYYGHQIQINNTNTPLVNNQDPGCAFSETSSKDNLNFAIAKYQEYKAYMNYGTISQYSGKELAHFIDEIYYAQKIFVSRGVFSLEELNIAEQKLENIEINIEESINTDRIETPYGNKIYDSKMIGITDDINNNQSLI